MAARVELVSVRKGKGAIHLAVRVEAEREVETLCERQFGVGESAATELGPTCVACIRRSNDPGRISNALFGQDMGATLLELSLAGGHKLPEDRRADERAATAEPPRLTVVRSGQQPDTPREAERAHSPGGLDLSRFAEVGRDLYRSPGGVTLRLVRRRSGEWDVADIDCDGATRIEHLGDGRVRIRAGDIRIEYGGTTDRKLRLT
ncbi:MAG: hypothetical protein M3Z13_03845 [Candidatus Dormibacteraeota bacterium]|nr:hypothetical protein [Candidatus Dormibacteraeota bacterium]